MHGTIRMMWKTGGGFELQPVHLIHFSKDSHRCSANSLKLILSR